MDKLTIKEYFNDEQLEDIYKGVKEKFEVDPTLEVIGFEKFIFTDDSGTMDSENYVLVKLCRLFMGNLLFYNEEIDEELPLLDTVFQTMFVSNESLQDEEAKKNELIEFIFEFSILKDEDEELKLYSLLDTQFRSNRLFYKDILNEVEHYIAYQSNQSYLPAFVHLYRIYEYMSYAFPLTYIQNTNDFYGSYDDLQRFFNDTSSAELAFFDRFINEVFLKNDYIYNELYNQYFEINFKVNNYHSIKSTLQLIVNILNSKKKKGVNKILRDMGKDEVEKAAYFDDETSSINIHALTFHSFIIEIRNKIFHFKASRRDSIFANDIYFEDIFEILNDHIYNWIAMNFKFILHSALE